MNLSRAFKATRSQTSPFGAKNQLFRNSFRSPVAPAHLYARPQRNFGWLMAIQPGFIIGKLKKIFASRAGLYRFLFVCAGIHLVTTFSGSFMEREIMMSVSDYYTNLNIKDNELYKMYGILQKGTLEMKRGSLDAKFILTDFQNQVEVKYNGATKFEFKEGETLVLTAYTPDGTKKNQIVCIDYMTKHGMEVDAWQDGSGYQRENYGLMKSQGSSQQKYTRIT